MKVIVQGYGSAVLPVQLVVTQGYLSGTPPPPVTNKKELVNTTLTGTLHAITDTTKGV